MDYNTELEEVTHRNIDKLAGIDRGDVPESFAGTAETLMALTDYGVAHNCAGHSFAVKYKGKYIGYLLIGDALKWDTDPPEMSTQPFYRLLCFAIDKAYRRNGIGGKALEAAIEAVYGDYGVRPVALGCHRDNTDAARFYCRHGFTATAYTDGDDIYYLRYPAERTVKAERNGEETK